MNFTIPCFLTPLHSTFDKTAEKKKSPKHKTQAIPAQRRKNIN